METEIREVQDPLIAQTCPLSYNVMHVQLGSLFYKNENVSCNGNQNAKYE